MKNFQYCHRGNVIVGEGETLRDARRDCRKKLDDSLVAAARPIDDFGITPDDAIPISEASKLLGAVIGLCDKGIGEMSQEVDYLAHCFPNGITPREFAEFMSLTDKFGIRALEKSISLYDEREEK